MLKVPQSIGLDTSEHAWGGKEQAEFSFQILSTQLALPFNPTPAWSDLSYCPIFGTQATDDSCRGPFFFFFAKTILKLTNPNFLILEQQPKETWTVLTTWLSPSKLSYCPYPFGKFFYTSVFSCSSPLFGYVETNYKWNVRDSFLTHFAILHFSDHSSFFVSIQKFHLKVLHGWLSAGAKILMVTKNDSISAFLIFGSVEKALFIKWLYKKCNSQKNCKWILKLFV